MKQPLDIWGSTQVDDFIKKSKCYCFPHNAYYSDGIFELDIEVFGWKYFYVQLLCCENGGSIGLKASSNDSVLELKKAKKMFPAHKYDRKRAYLYRNIAMTCTGGLLFQTEMGSGSEGSNSLCKFIGEEIEKFNQVSIINDFQL